MKVVVNNLDIVLRNLDPIIINKIDLAAQKQKQSRQLYLKSHIELLATDYMQSEKVSHLEKQLQANTIALKEFSKVIDRMSSIVEELIAEGDED